MLPTTMPRRHENSRRLQIVSSWCLGAFVRRCSCASSAAPRITPPPVSSCASIKPGATVTISHDAFPGYMDAMAMPFDLKGSARAAKLTPGDRVKFRLSVKGGHSWVDRVDVVSAAPVDAGLQNTPAVPVLVPVGTAMPDFELTDQAGQAGRACRR